MENATDNSQTNLIINYLPQTLTDEEFRNLFVSIGPVKSSKIVRHKATGYSYGFGFVDYQTIADAARAVETLNGLQLQNKKIKVAYARPGGETIKHANLYIRGIPKHYPAEQAEKLFADFGKLIQFRVLRDETGTNKGVAFALYDLRENAEAAMATLTGQTLPGATEPLLVKFAEDNAKKLRPPLRAPVAGGGPMRGAQGRYRYNPLTGSYSYPMAGGAPEGGHVLFVYNIGADTDEKSLWQLFAQYGSVTKVNIIRDTATGLSKGFGFVTMANYQDCVWAIEALNGFRYAGRPLQVSFKQPK
ncbi:ELAV-like protein 1 [Ornithodoros turicata]|uniref:ELAV-like protein 1 n=1 Tax=Ornithodoros turicata TaxID=34597 RepID=UPI003139ADA0